MVKLAAQNRSIGIGLETQVLLQDCTWYSNTLIASEHPRQPTQAAGDVDIRGFLSKI